MLKWLGKLRLWRRESNDSVVHDYGQYVNKPVMSRALAMVMNVDAEQLDKMIWDDVGVSVNGVRVSPVGVEQRLHSGAYKVIRGSTIWTFFIA